MARKKKLEVCVPKEIPILRFFTPYGSMSIYSPTNNPLTPERVLLMLEQAKFKILHDMTVNVNPSVQ